MVRWGKVWDLWFGRVGSGGVWFGKVWDLGLGGVG